MLWLMVLYFIKVLVREQTKSELERAYRGQGHALFWNRLYIHFGNRDRRDGVTKLVPTVSTVTVVGHWRLPGRAAYVGRVFEHTAFGTLRILPPTVKLELGGVLYCIEASLNLTQLRPPLYTCSQHLRYK